jgi:hypothetical protein
MAILQNTIVAATPASEGDVVTRSLRFEDNAYLSFTPSSATSTRQKAVINFWFKVAEPEAASRYCYLFTAGTVQGASTEWFGIMRSAADGKIHIANTFGVAAGVTTEAAYRDYAAWYNLHLIVDTTQSTSTDRFKLYINGERQTLTGTYPSQNSNLYIGDAKPHRFSYQDNPGYHATSFGIQAYIANAYLLENSTLPYTDFIEDNGYGGFKPKATSGLTFGTNGFHLNAQQGHSADLLVSSIARNDGDTLFADAAKGHGLTAGGGTEHSIAVGNPFTGDDRAIYFDGSGDYLQTSTSSDLTFGTGDFTVELWFNPASTNTSNSYKGIISDEVYSSTGGWAVSQRDDELSLWIKNTGGSWVSFVADGALTANQWQHIAVSYDSSTTTTRLFVDGTVVASGTTSGWNLTGDQVEIGRSVSGQDIAGYLFDVRVTKGQARYTSSFTPPTSKLTADSDTKLLIQPHKDDTDFHDESDSGHTFTTYGTPTRTASTPYDAAAKSTAMFFDGSNDWVQVSTASSDFQFGTGDFTIEGWYYFTHLNSAQVICDLRPSNVADSTRPSFNTTGANMNMHFNNSNTTVGTGGLTTTQWQHIAIVRSSGSLKVY